jgi:hypothetical protein
MGNRPTQTPVQQMLEEIKDDIVDAAKKAEHASQLKEAQKRVQKIQELNELEAELNALEEKKVNKKQPRHFLFDYIDKYHKKMLEKDQRE